MRRKILLVNDIESDCILLSRMLKKDFDILSVSDGEEAMALLKKHSKVISAIVLDPVIPWISGFAAMEKIRNNPAYQHIPIIIETSHDDDCTREKAIAYGANGFVTKPFKRTLLINTLQNAIKLSEMSAAASTLRRDTLTGLLNRESSFAEAERMICSHEPGYYVLSCYDVDSFKVVNDQYGTERGDETLVHIGNCINELVSEFSGLTCRLSADKFAILCPVKFIDSEKIHENHVKSMSPPCISRKIRIRIGRYIVDDISLPISAMLDRATLAEESIKGRYDVYISYFTDSMRAGFIREQQLVNAMADAIGKNEFEVWYQPQFNHATGAMIGAEALVRWKHDGVYISPEEFIPVFERGGFIYEMDQFIWNEVCRVLRSRLDAGLKPVPLSVNISRRDLFHQHFIQVFTDIINKYSIPNNLIRLEVTESAFAESTKVIIAKVDELINLGFIVEIDDFGSGYSSLNTLKDVPASILKLDMKFLEETSNAKRGGNILESVVLMAKWLGMAVIAEGVETLAQADYLKSIGCNYVQGYLYARPMPLDEFEKLCASSSLEERHNRLVTADSPDNNTFWDPNLMETLVFNTCADSACVFEYRDGKTELLRYNDRYKQVLGAHFPVGSVTEKTDSHNRLDKKNRKKLFDSIISAIETREETTCEISLPDSDGHTQYLRPTIRVIAKAVDRYLLYCVIDNVTELREAQMGLYAANENITEQRQLLDNLPCGVALYEYVGEKISVVHINKRYWQMVGRKAANHSKKSVIEKVHPDDRALIMQEIGAAIRHNRNITVDIRILCGESEYKPFHIIANVVKKKNGILQLYAFYIPLSEKVMSVQEMLPIALSTMLSASDDMSYIKDKDLRYICCSNSAAKIIGFENPREIIEKTDYDIFSKELADRFNKDDRQILKSGEPFVGRIEKIPGKNSGLTLVSTSKYPIIDSEGKVIGIYSVSRDITSQKEQESQLELLTKNIPGGLAAFSLNEDGLCMLCFNDGFYRFSGYTREEFLELTEKDPLALMFEEDRPEIRALTSSISKNKCDGKTASYSYRCHTKDGGYRWMNLEVCLSHISDGQYILNAVQLDITELKNIEENLRISEEEYRLSTRHSGRTICRYNIADKTMMITSEASKRLSLPECLTNVPYSSVTQGDISPDTTDAYIRFFESIIGGEKECSVIFQKRLPNGWRWLSAHSTTIFDKDRHPVSAIVSYEDITEQQEKEAVYRKWQQTLQSRDPDSYTLFRSNLNKSSNFDTREGTLLDYSVTDTSQSFGERVRDFADRYIYEKDREAYLKLVNPDTLLAGYYRGKRAAELEFREKRIDGTLRWLKLSVELVEYPNSKDVEAYLMYEDINDEKVAEIQTKVAAETDSLTALLNRKAFTEQITRKLSDKHSDSLYAVFLIDMDGFKLINDSFGHGAGDQVLIEAANTLRSILRDRDLICRLGGDEFIVCLCDMPSREVILRKAKQVCEMMRRAFKIDVRLSISLGISVCPDDGSDFETLYYKADKALYHIKENGKNGCAFYSDRMDGTLFTSSDTSASLERDGISIVDFDKASGSMTVLLPTATGTRSYTVKMSSPPEELGPGDRLNFTKKDDKK